MRTRWNLCSGLAATLLIGTRAVAAATLPCAPCAGVHTSDLTAAIQGLRAEPRLGEDDTFFLAWTVELDGSADRAAVDTVRSSGARPWIRAVFRTPTPVSNHLDELGVELAALAELVRGLGADATIQAVWRPADAVQPVAEHAFLLKRAAVAVTGAAPSATFYAGPVAAQPDLLQALYQEEVAAYLDGIALAPGDALAAAVAALTDLDPGKPVALDALPWPANPAEALLLAAEMSASGVAVTLFSVDTESITATSLTPLKVLAREFSGQLLFTDAATPKGPGPAWAFVDEDLGVHVIASSPQDRRRAELLFSDPTLRDPRRVDAHTGVESPLIDIRRSARGVTLSVDAPDTVLLVHLDRPSAEELQGFDEKIQVAAERQMPVEEILRRLQAFEDAQARRLHHYQATRALHLRFNGVRGSFEASYRGDFFYETGRAFDWVWEEFFVGGVKWRSKRMPELPLIQPEKVASQPVEIKLTRDYDYRLRGSASIDGRECWVIDFRPIDPVSSRSLYQGTVWVDREVFARVRTRAVQIGLEGSVLSSEETRFYAPVDAGGEPTQWSNESFVLPMRTTAQQTLSVLSVTLPVELENVLTDVRVNGSDFARNRDAALASDSTMVRDTDAGIRYLREDDSGQRVVEAEMDSSRLFVVGGVFWDQSVDFPVPLAGVNYLDLDFRESGGQLNIFFAGALLNAGLSSPRLFRSRWNGGANVNALFFKRSDELYRDGEVVPDEEVRSRTASASFFVGRPLWDFLSFKATYRLTRDDYSRADDTADGFVLPSDTFTNTLRARVEYNRAGYRLQLTGDVNSRSDWEFWGLPGNQEYDPAHKDYLRWRATLAKTWWFPNFRKLSIAAEHLDGSHLDRFSGYDFGLFGNASVAGYQGGLVRAEQADGLHLTLGKNYFEKVRFEVEGDAVWASNRVTGLDNELLAGVGVGGTVTLPWQLIMNFEAGVALEGPGKGNVALRVFFLKLFPGM